MTSSFFLFKKTKVISWALGNFSYAGCLFSIRFGRSFQPLKTNSHEGHEEKNKMQDS